MSRNTQIRWREADLKELRRLTKNYNAKLARQRKKLLADDKLYQASQLPKKVSVKEARKAIGTRKEFNAEIERMQNYIDTGMKFRMDANTKKSLQATVRDFNSKVERLEKQAKSQGEKAALPEKLDIDEMMKQYSSKEALQRDIKDYKRFLKSGAEELVELPDSKNNIKLTKWQKESMERRLDYINAARERELEEWRATEVKFGGESAGYTQGMLRMDRGDFDEFSPMNLYNFSSTYGDMREKFRLMIREGQPGYWDARAELAKLNYIEKMDSIIGNHPLGDYLMEKIKNAPLSDFKRTLKSEDDLFLLLYDLEKQPDNYNTILEKIWNEWAIDEDMVEVGERHFQTQGYQSRSSQWAAREAARQARKTRRRK